MKARIVYGNPTRYYAGGKEVTKEEFDRLFPDVPIGDGAGLTGWKPLHSEALCVHPKRIGEAVKDARDKGVPTEFDKMGRPVFTSRAHRKAYLKAYRVHDNNGGYGD